MIFCTVCPYFIRLGATLNPRFERGILKYASLLFIPTLDDFCSSVISVLLVTGIVHFKCIPKYYTVISSQADGPSPLEINCSKFQILALNIIITNFALNLLAFLLTSLFIAIAAASIFYMGVGLEYSDSNLRNLAC